MAIIRRSTLRNLQEHLESLLIAELRKGAAKLVEEFAMGFRAVTDLDSVVGSERVAREAQRRFARRDRPKNRIQK